MPKQATQIANLEDFCRTHHMVYRPGRPTEPPITSYGDLENHLGFPLQGVQTLRPIMAPITKYANY